MDIFSSPLESPSKFTLKREESAILHMDHPRREELVPVAFPQSEDIERRLFEKEQKVMSTPVNRPCIQLTSRAHSRTPVQSDTTNRLISSSNNLPSVTTHSVFGSSLSTPYYVDGADQYHFSSPMELTKMPQKVTQPCSSFGISPPRTRSAARR